MCKFTKNIKFTLTITGHHNDAWMTNDQECRERIAEMTSRLCESIDAFYMCNFTSCKDINGNPLATIERVEA